MLKRTLSSTYVLVCRPKNVCQYNSSYLSQWSPRVIFPPFYDISSCLYRLSNISSGVSRTQRLKAKTTRVLVCLYVLKFHVNNFFSIVRVVPVFRSWIRTIEQRIQCLAQGHRLHRGSIEFWAGNPLIPSLMLYRLSHCPRD